MNCDRCGQRVNEVPACEHRFVGQAADGTLRCTYCGHNFGPVRELIEKVGLWNLYGSSAGAAELIATLTRERDEARACLRILQANYATRKTECENVLRQCQQAEKERDEALSAYRIQAEDCRQARIKLDNLRTLCEAADRERDEARRQRDEWASTAGRVGADLSAARARIAELEKATAPFTARDLVVHANGTWEWRKV